jgi:hypothetical protein
VPTVLYLSRRFNRESGFSLEVMSHISTAAC